jgi:hypothetical protein
MRKAPNFERSQQMFRKTSYLLTPLPLNVKARVMNLGAQSGRKFCGNRVAYRNLMEAEFIRLYRSKDPGIGYNQCPKGKS